MSFVFGMWHLVTDGRGGVNCFVGDGVRIVFEEGVKPVRLEILLTGLGEERRSVMVEVQQELVHVRRKPLFT